MTMVEKRKALYSIRFLLFDVSSNKNLDSYQKKHLLIDFVYLIATNKGVDMEELESVERLVRYEIDKKELV